jgi:hypothetical protein
MLVVTAILVPIVVALAVLDIRRWTPWVADRIVRAAARCFDEPNRPIKDEEYRANVRYAGGPLSMIAYALFTFAKAPFRARELRARSRATKTSVATQAARLVEIPIAGWKSDSERSAAEYDAWYLARSSAIFKRERTRFIADAADALRATHDFRKLDVDSLITRPRALAVARACTCPPMASRQLITTCGVRPRLVTEMERDVIPEDAPAVLGAIQAMCDFLWPRLDRWLLCWLDEDRAPTEEERKQALLAIGERMAQATPRIVSGKHAHQHGSLRAFLESCGFVESSEPAFEMSPGTFSLNRNIPEIALAGWPQKTEVDCVIAPLDPELPRVVIESLSSGDSINSSKRLNVATNMGRSLRMTCGQSVVVVLHLFGHFRSQRLDENAAEISWVWDHRLSDLQPLLGIGG